MILKGKWLKDSLPLSWRLARAEWLLLTLLFLVGTALDIGVEDAMQLLTPTEETQRWVMALGEGVWELIAGVLTFLVLSAAIGKVRQPQNPEILAKPFAQPYLSSLLAEYLRLLAQTLMWGLLLLLPGFFRYCQLIFVPLIAVFSKSYREGNQDALEFAEKLSKGRLLRLVVVMGLTTALEVLFGYFPEMNATLHGYIPRILCELASFAVNIWTYALIFLLFEDALQNWKADPEEAAP